MFGYVYINKPELKIREFDRYRAHYCGLCRGLKSCAGLKGRMTLNYDMTFLVIFLTSLYEPEVKIEKKRCLAHPFVKHEEITSEITEYAADMNMLMAYYNLMDDWKDDKKPFRLIYALLLRKKVKRIEERYGKKAETVKKCLAELERMEAAGEEDIDLPAVAFGEIMGQMFLYGENDPMAEEIHDCGFYLGKYIYILDAYEDIEEDLKKGRYNPLGNIYGSEDFEDTVDTLLLTAIQKSTAAFERLPLIDDAEIMRNILYAGCLIGYEHIKEKRINGSI